MDIHFLQTRLIDGKDQTADGIADQTIEKLDSVYDLSLGDGRGDVNIPGSHTGEILVLREQTVEKGGTAAIIADNEKRFFDRLFFIGREEDLIEPKADPVEDGHKGPNSIEKQQEKYTLTRQASGCVGCFEPSLISHTPEKAEVVSHKGFLFSFKVNRGDCISAQGFSKHPPLFTCYATHSVVAVDHSS